MERLKVNSPPRGLSDKTSKAHDLRYSLANDADDIREADQKMVKKLKEIKKKKQDSKFNILQGEKLITSKMALEDLGIIKKDRFHKKQDLSKKEKKLLEDELKELEQEGFGKDEDKEMVGKEVKREIIKEYLHSGKVDQPKPIKMSDIKKGRKKVGKGPVATGGAYKKGKGVTTTGSQPSGAGVKPTGAGVTTTGAKPHGAGMKGGLKLNKKLVDVVVNDMIPEVLKEANISGYSDKVKDVIKQMAKRSKDVDEFLSHAASVAVHGTIRNKVTKKGSGMKGEGLKEILIDPILEKYNKKADKLALNLAKFLKKHALVALKKKMGGKGQSGSGIFGDIGRALKDFATGFASGWNSTAKLFDSIPVLGEVSKKVIPRLPGDKFAIDWSSFKLKKNPKPTNFGESVSSIINSVKNVAAIA